MNTLNDLQSQFEQFKQMKLNLNIERGQPADANFDLSLPLLNILSNSDYTTDKGVDIRNYPGGIYGLAEARELFSQQLRVQPAEIMIGNSSSLELMSHFLSWALLKGVYGSNAGWLQQKPKLIVTVPGYDRHFSLAQSLGFELVCVDITENGPDMDAVEQLVANDERIKGIYFVPTYSNPTGDSISAAFAQRLVSMPCAASDFTVFADDAYAVHHLVDNPAEMPNLLELAKAANNAERVILFGSTSKITFASAGISFAGMSEANLAFWGKQFSVQSIGPNKAEQWRHVRFLRQYPDGITGLMKDHAAILAPKFDVVDTTLTEQLGNQALASWTKPKGGYFVSVETHRPIATRVIELAASLGVALTPSGATYPNAKDPKNTNIRLSPTRPPVEEVKQAMEVVAFCIQLASAEFDAAANA